MRILLLVGLTLGLVACDAGQLEPDPDALQVREVVFATADGTVAAYSHDDHWHGTLRATVGEPADLEVWLVTADAPADGPRRAAARVVGPSVRP